MSGGETLGDIAARELREEGFIVPREFEATRREQLERLSSEARILFAAAVAERAMRAHESLPSGEQAAYTLGWRPALDRIWDWAAGDRRAYDDVSRALAEFLLSPQNHVDGQDGPADADDDAAAATIYAVECCTHAYPVFADAAATRAVELAYNRACEDADWKRSHEELSDFAQDLAHPLVQDELARQRQDLEFLLGSDGRLAIMFEEPAPADVLERLRG